MSKVNLPIGGLRVPPKQDLSIVATLKEMGTDIPSLKNVTFRIENGEFQYKLNGDTTLKDKNILKNFEYQKVPDESLFKEVLDGIKEKIKNTNDAKSNDESYVAAEVEAKAFKTANISQIAAFVKEAYNKVLAEIEKENQKREAEEEAKRKAEEEKNSLRSTNADYKNIQDPEKLQALLEVKNEEIQEIKQRILKIGAEKNKLGNDTLTEDQELASLTKEILGTYNYKLQFVKLSEDPIDETKVGIFYDKKADTIQYKIHGSTEWKVLDLSEELIEKLKKASEIDDGTDKKDTKILIEEEIRIKKEMVSKGILTEEKLSPVINEHDLHTIKEPKPNNIYFYRNVVDQKLQFKIGKGDIREVPLDLSSEVNEKIYYAQERLELFKGYSPDKSISNYEDKASLLKIAYNEKLLLGSEIRELAKKGADKLDVKLKSTEPNKKVTFEQPRLRSISLDNKALDKQFDDIFQSNNTKIIKGSDKALPGAISDTGILDSLKAIDAHLNESISEFENLIKKDKNDILSQNFNIQKDKIDIAKSSIEEFLKNNNMIGINNKIAVKYPSFGEVNQNMSANDLLNKFIKVSSGKANDASEAFLKLQKAIEAIEKTELLSKILEKAKNDENLKQELLNYKPPQKKTVLLNNKTGGGYQVAAQQEFHVLVKRTHLYKDLLGILVNRV